MTKRDLVAASTRHHLVHLLKYYPRPPCAPSFVKSRILCPLQRHFSVFQQIFFILVCKHAGNPRVPPRVLAFVPKPCGRNNWIGEHELTKQNKNICFESRKKDTKTSSKTHEWNGMTILYFQQCACVNISYFAPVVTTTYRMKNNKSSTRRLSLEMSVLAKVRAQLLNTLHSSTHLSVPHGDNI